MFLFINNLVAPEILENYFQKSVKDSKILVLGGLGEDWDSPTAVTNDPNTQGDDYETIPSEIFDIKTGISTRVGDSETWKRKDGVHPKDYLFPLLIPSDTLYCKSN